MDNRLPLSGCFSVTHCASNDGTWAHETFRELDLIPDTQMNLTDFV